MTVPKDALVIWQDGLAFEGTAGSGFSVRLDTSPDEGGGSGFSPMELVLVGLAGCTEIGRAHV
jgi:putative redox protein